MTRPHMRLLTLMGIRYVFSGFLQVSRVDDMEIDDNRVRFFLLGTKTEKGATVRFNLLRWPGTLAGDLRYVLLLSSPSDLVVRHSAF